MSISEIMDGVDFLLDDFEQIAQKGMSTYRDYRPEVLIEHDARAQASCIYCHMLAEADRRFMDRNDMRLVDIRGLKVWVVNDLAVVRFKKMGDDGSSRNYQTQQAKDYDANNQLPGIPPPAPRLTVGYVPDATGTAIERVQVARPMGRRVEWCAAIVPSEDRVEGNPNWIDVTQQRMLLNG